MPVRVTCPACSATLSIRDEFAGRAVKCPKCAGLIPPQPAAPATVSEAESVATVPPPPPAPSKPKPERRREPEPEPEPQPESEPQPVVSAKAESEDAPPRARDDRDDDDDDRPRKRKRRDEEDEDDDRPRRRRREEEDDRDRDDDRPRRRRRDEDDDDDRPRKKRRRDEDDDGPVVKSRYNAARESNTGIVVAVAVLLLCFVAVGGGIYAYSQNDKANRETEAANAAAAKEKEAAAAFLASFEKVKITDPRGRADDALGSGRAATAEDVSKVFRNSADPKKVTEWGAKVKDGRVLIWQSGESFALVALHPDADGRVMAKAMRAKNVSIDVGDLNDASFAKRYPLKGETPPKGEPPPKKVAPAPMPPDPDAVVITATQLLQEYAADAVTADARYKGKVLTVSGPVGNFLDVGGFVTISMAGDKARGVVQLQIKGGATNGAEAAFRGQPVRVRGMCDGKLIFPTLSDCEVLEVVPVEFITAAADALLADFAKDPAAAGKKYAGSATDGGLYLHLTDARVVAVEKNGLLLTGPTRPGAKPRLRVRYFDREAKAFAGLKAGDAVSVKGVASFQFAGLTDDLVIDWARVAP